MKVNRVYFLAHEKAPMKSVKKYRPAIVGRGSRKGPATHESWAI